MHSGSSLRLASQNWQTETVLAEDSEVDLRSFNFGLATARRRALDRSAWRLLIETATST